MPEPGHHLRAENASTAISGRIRDVLIVGGGQSALAVAYFLRRTSLSVVLLDDGHAPGGAWVHGWDSLRLFSPAQWSSLPGWGMPVADGYPTRDDVVQYLSKYEKRYDFSIKRPVSVTEVIRKEGGFIVHTDHGVWRYCSKGQPPNGRHSKKGAYCRIRLVA